MTIGLVGRKCGMTRIFAEDGASIPVTVIEVEPNKVTQIKGVKLMATQQSKSRQGGVKLLESVRLKLGTLLKQVWQLVEDYGSFA